jgi:hypothetical protein
MAGGFAHRHNVVDKDQGRARAGKGAPCFGLEFFTIADDGVDFRHRGKIFRRSLSGAARYNNLRVGPRAPEPANVFSRGPNRFIRDGAAVDDDGSCKARLKRQSAHGFAFSRVKPAAEREDFISRGHRRAYVGQLPVKDKARR